MKAVKEVLKRDKLPKDYPPTMIDVHTREKHVPESIRYNIQKHAGDHVDNAEEQLKKLHKVNPSMAHKYGAESLAEMLRLAERFRPYTGNKCKECK